MLRRFILSALLFSATPAGALAQPSPTPTPAAADADAVCFVSAAVSVRRLERGGAATTQTERDRRTMLQGVANFYGGRVSARHSLQQVPAVLERAVAAATSLDLLRHAGQCSGQFLAFMRVVAGNN